MKATGALPTEDRVKKMNKTQWLWYYYNLKQSEKKKREEMDDIIEYLTFFINYDMAKSVRDKKNKNNSKYKEENVQNANEVYNDEFEKEIEGYLKNETFVELPSSNYKSSTESKDEFIERALQMEQLIQQNPDAEYFKEIEVPRRRSNNRSEFSENKNINLKENKDLTEEEILKMNEDNDLDIIFTND